MTTHRDAHSDAHLDQDDTTSDAYETQPTQHTEKAHAKAARSTERPKAHTPRSNTRRQSRIVKTAHPVSRPARSGPPFLQRVIVNGGVILAGLALVGWSDANRGWAIPEEPTKPTPVVQKHHK